MTHSINDLIKTGASLRSRLLGYLANRKRADIPIGGNRVRKLLTNQEGKTSTGQSGIGEVHWGIHPNGWQRPRSSRKTKGAMFQSTKLRFYSTKKKASDMGKQTDLRDKVERYAKL